MRKLVCHGDDECAGKVKGPQRHRCFTFFISERVGMIDREIKRIEGRQKMRGKNKKENARKKIDEEVLRFFGLCLCNIQGQIFSNT